MKEWKNRTNCPNCGAALPQFGGKCEFCGTRVIDLTAIDFDANEPTMFLLRLPRSALGGQPATISMWANPELNAITMESSSYSYWNEMSYRMPEPPQVAFEMTLHPCADPRDNSMFKMEIINEKYV